MVLDPSQNAIGTYDVTPFVPPQSSPDSGPATLWSDRRVRSFTVTNAGTYTIAFGASPLAGSMGSVAIAAVQLEQATTGQPTDYVPTTDTTLVSGLNCAMSATDLRSAFTHICNGKDGCYYDLSVPLILDTSALDGTPLSAKLANHNYNYRHITSAINLVGTGVHSCAKDPNANCYSSGYVQYDLEHDATNAGIVAYDGNARIFDFGLATVQGGKALAAERYITMPLSANDKELITQPGIQHVELGGRPLDGTYHLRIADSPDLNWSALEDVQLILDYEYWSQIRANGASQEMRRPRLGRAVRSPVVVSRSARR
jgi:hypothetical protein